MYFLLKNDMNHHFVRFDVIGGLPSHPQIGGSQIGGEFHDVISNNGDSQGKPLF